MQKKIFLTFSILIAMSMLFAACTAPEVIEKETIIEKTVVVTQIVEGNSEVEIQEKVIVVTATPEPEAQKLEIFHWWTASGEREATDAMFKAFKEAYPEIEVIENPVAGGGGTSHRVILQARITAGMPPDTFQTLGGAELKNYVDSDVLQPLDDFYAETGYADVIPRPVLNAVSVDGSPYVVPLNIHIQNILYYNMKLFNELEITPPTTFDEMIAACETITGAKPEMDCLGLGSKEKWGVPFIFDSLYLETAGAENYVKFHKGEIDVTEDENYKTALERFEELSTYINDDHSALTWDQAVGLVGSEEAAMTIMGTWATGAFINGSNWEAGIDFGAVTFPQQPERILLFHTDAFGLATYAPHPDTTINWLKAVASPELQIPTEVIHGGLFARTDINPAEFPDPIRQEMQTYLREHPDMLILDQHGSILPTTAQAIYWDILVNFLVGASDVDDTIEAVADMFDTCNVLKNSAWYQWP